MYVLTMLMLTLERRLHFRASKWSLWEVKTLAPVLKVGIQARDPGGGFSYGLPRGSAGEPPQDVCVALSQNGG